jgi:lysophospholipase L1-like esterase
LGEHTQSDYQLAYGHWRGEPPQLLDTHPNAVAHGRIAEAILQALSR